MYALIRVNSDRERETARSRVVNVDVVRHSDEEIGVWQSDFRLNPTDHDFVAELADQLPIDDFALLEKLQDFSGRPYAPKNSERKLFICVP